MRRREVPDDSTVPRRLRRYVAAEWDSPTDWYAALQAHHHATGESVETDPDTEWPDVAFTADDL